MKRLPILKQIIFLNLFFSFGLAPAQTNSNKTLQAVHSKLLKVKDYTVRANIKVDMPFIKILPINAEIFFKQKDKFRVKSEGIAIVPRQGFAQASKILDQMNSFNAVSQGTEKIAGIPAEIVSIIPLSDTSDLILGKLWIDSKSDLILKTQFTTRSSGTILIEYTYGAQAEYGLPDKMIFTVDVKKFKLPVNVAANTSHDTEDTVDKTNPEKKGKITITFTKYQINNGISDNVFKDK